MHAKPFVLSLVLYAITLAAMAQQTISLDGTWRFKYCPDAQTADRYVSQQFYANDYDVSAFDQQPVPSNWALQGYEEPVYRGFPDDKASEGLYVRIFKLPQTELKRALLHFGGVWASAEVWVNGKYVGRHDSGYTSFTFDISDFVKRGADNRLAVRVRQVYRSYKFDTYDDWTLGGIYRPVTIELMPKCLWIDHVQTLQTFSDNYRKAVLTARVFVCDMQKQLRPGNYPTPGAPYQLRATLTDPKGNVVAETAETVPSHVATGRQTDLTLRVTDPQLWNAETPNLYRLDIALFLPKAGLEDDRQEWEPAPLMQWSDRIGLREIKTSKDGTPMLCINGQKVTLRGVNYHNEYPTVGRAQTKEMWIKDLQQMKRTNINYLRLCHYPHAQEFIELCDSMGFYCTEEISLGGASQLMYEPAQCNMVLMRTYETVTRDLNRPSIICWTVGNEDAFTPLHQAAARACKAFDPTRPRLIPWRYENHLPLDDIDMLSVHYWHPRECDSLTAQANRPVISTEYTHAFGEMGMGGLDQRFRAMTRHPQGAGAAVWMWQDQGLKLPTDERLRLSDAGWDGIVDSYRRQGRDWQEVRETYNPVFPVSDTLDLSGTADNSGRKATSQIVLYNGYDFTDMSSATISWQTYDARGKLQKKGSMQAPQAAPHTTASISLPVKNTAYAHLTFIAATGDTLGQRSVTFDAGQALSSRKTSASSLSAARVLLSTMKPCVWRKLDNSEASVIGSKLVRRAPKDWTKYTVQDLGNNSYLYVYNDSNMVRFSYTLTEIPEGIRVDYTIKPTLSVPRVPVVGVTLDMPKAIDGLRWRGLGPMNCYSNKYRAAIDGVWNVKDAAEATPGSSIGSKRTRWIETSGYHIDNDGYVEAEGATLRILKGIAARPEKGRRANDEFPDYGSTAADPAISGFFIIRQL